jgi:hypothetical protein
MKLSYPLCLILVIFLYACINAKIKVVIPCFIKNDVENYMQPYKYMAIIYMYKNGCTPCSLSIWQHLENNLNKIGTGILLVFQQSDRELINENLKLNNIHFPFIVDKDGTFKQANNSIFESAMDNTFVIDRDKNVIFTEAPIKDEKTWNRFIKRTKK